jgi:large subunit ribosomal protein L13
VKKMIVIDAKDQIMGRMATKVAKLALRGETIRVVNCAHVVMTGTRELVLSQLQQKIQRGVPLKGPYYPKQSDRIVRRVIRGMLPYKQPKGRDAYARVLCFSEVPEDLADTEKISFPEASITKSHAKNYVYLKELVTHVGGSR